MSCHGCVRSSTTRLHRSSLLFVSHFKNAIILNQPMIDLQFSTRKLPYRYSATRHSCLLYKYVGEWILRLTEVWWNCGWYKFRFNNPKNCSTLRLSILMIQSGHYWSHNGMTASQAPRLSILITSLGSPLVDNLIYEVERLLLTPTKLSNSTISGLHRHLGLPLSEQQPELVLLNSIET